MGSVGRMRVLLIALTLAAGLLLAPGASAVAGPIRPDPAGPRDEPVIYHNGCHAGRLITTVKVCEYGDRAGVRTVVVLGDSHVAQWFGGLRKAARAEGVRLLWLTKSACPAADVSVRVWRGSARYPECDTWRGRALATIARIRPDVVVTASYAYHQVLDRGTGRKLKGKARAAEWRRGTARTLAALSAAAGQVVLLRDTPRQKVDVPVCLVAHRLRAKKCRTATAWALPTRLWDVERTVAAGYPTVRTVDLATPMCGPRWCRPVTGEGIMRYRDDSHLTDTYARRLAPQLRPLLRVEGDGASTTAVRSDPAGLRAGTGADG